MSEHPTVNPRGEFVEPAGREPREVADEQFAHGLLEHLGHDDAATQRQRVAAAMARIGGGAMLRPVRSWRRVVLMASAMAAAVFVVATVSWLAQIDDVTDVTANLRSGVTQNTRYEYLAELANESTLHGDIDFGVGKERLMTLYPQIGGDIKRVLRHADGWCMHNTPMAVDLIEVFKRCDKNSDNAVSKAEAGERDWSYLVRLDQNRDLVVARTELGVAIQKQANNVKKTVEWPAWVRSGSVIAPVRSPREWLRVMADTHRVSWQGSDRIVGKLRLGETDPLLPERFELVLTEHGAAIEEIVLTWPIAPPANGGAAPDRSAIEVLEGRPDVATSTQTPRRVVMHRVPAPKRPQYWFQPAIFRVR
jgi:hypothetical protein